MRSRNAVPTESLIQDSELCIISECYQTVATGS
jgi:hypothetical protein